MRRQLKLWPTSKDPYQFPEIWKTLTSQQKQDIITALADLISKMARTEDIDQEENHER